MFPIYRKKIWFKALLAVLILFVATSSHAGEAGTGAKLFFFGETPDQRKEMMKDETFLKQKLPYIFNAIFPSFNYGGEEFDVTTWTKSLDTISSSEQYDEYLFRRKAPDGKMIVAIQAKIYKDYPVIEWIPILENPSNAKSQIVSNFQSLDFYAQIPLPPSDVKPGEETYISEEVIMRRTLGAKTYRSDFITEKITLRLREDCWRTEMTTREGRSSGTWLPFFGFEFADQSFINVGVGWSGAWQAKAEIDGVSKNLHIQAGLIKTNFYLEPGEKIRQPAIFLQFSHLPYQQTQNQLRQFMIAHHTPRNSKGELITGLISAANWGGLKTKVIMNNLKYIDENKLPFDMLWVDAGWYGEPRQVATGEFSGSDWYQTVGDWRVNKSIHPNGLKPIGDEARRQGLKFLLWIEMQRYNPKSPIVSEHPEWFPPFGDVDDNRMLDFSIPDARQWAIDTVVNLMENEGMDYYREDCNFNPYVFWEKMDAPDRVGIAESKYIPGHWAFWDALREKYPDILIDNCASGGRRIDFESMSRSIVLYRDDLLSRAWFDASEVCQMQTLYLNQWVPVQQGGARISEFDDYAFLSSVGVGFDGWASRANPDWLREMLTLARKMNHYFYGDFYPLTENPEDMTNFCAYQLDLPKEDQGFFIIFRRKKCKKSTLPIQLANIDVNAEYKLEKFRGETVTIKGTELQNRIESMPEPRSVALYFYNKEK